MEVAIGGILGVLAVVFFVGPYTRSCDRKMELDQATRYETKMQECLQEKNTKVICEAALRQLGYYPARITSSRGNE